MTTHGTLRIFKLVKSEVHTEDEGESEVWNFRLCSGLVFQLEQGLSLLNSEFPPV